MCGIVGYIGQRRAYDILIQGLHRLEYRGYDSSGVAMVSDAGQLNIYKSKGKVEALEHFASNKDLSGTIGIAHTRWATHGEPSDVNSHPHFNMDRTIAVVHNGIIENYMELKEELQAEGVVFLSQTDTEVVAHLVDKYYEGNLLDAVYKATQKLRGAYALGVVCADNNNELVAVRKDSPLVVGLGEDENFIASDIPAILKYTRDEYKTLGRYSTDINTYVESQYAHWVVDGGVDKEWDEYLSILNEMGLKELLKLYDTAYNRYLKSQQ